MTHPIALVVAGAAEAGAHGTQHTVLGGLQSAFEPRLTREPFFEPFFATFGRESRRPRTFGSLGYGDAKRGVIRIESTPGSGSRLPMYLPKSGSDLMVDAPIHEATV